jgi:hypothetical protein
LGNLRLEELTAEDSDCPAAYIWFSNKSKSDLNCEAARVALDIAAKDLLSVEELKGTKSANTDDVLLYLPSPSKGALLRALAEGDGKGFVDLFISQFDLMARFVPVLDKVFSECLTNE